MGEISLPYGNTDVFFTVEADELLLNRSHRRPRPTAFLSEEIHELVDSGRKVEMAIDVKFLLDDDLINSLSRIIHHFKEKGVTVSAKLIGSKGLVLSLSEGILGRIGLEELPTCQPTDNIDLILGFFTSFTFLDSLRLLCNLGVKEGSGFIEDSIAKYIEHDDSEALSIFLDSAFSSGYQLPPIISIRDQDGEYRTSILRDKRSFQENLSSWRGESMLELPKDANCLFASLGGQPNDLVPSLGIPYMIDVANRLDLDAMGFAAIWKHSAADIEMLLSRISGSEETESGLEAKTPWQKVMANMIKAKKPGKKVRLLTSLHPLVVDKVLGWKATSSANETIVSLRRAVETRLRLCAVGDITNNRPSRA